VTLGDLVQKHSLRKVDLGVNKFTATTIPPVVSTMSSLESLGLAKLGFLAGASL
jgi:hypothetical protein